MSKQLNYKQKLYIGTTETDFKHRFNKQTKSINLEHYENDAELSKEYWTIKRNHFTPKVTWRIIRICAHFNTTKRKCYLCLNEKLEIASYKVDNLLNKTSSPFYRIIARTKSYVFTEIFLALFPLGPPFWPARLMFCIIWFSKQKSSSSKRRFLLANIVVNISCEDGTEMTSPFPLDTITL